MNTLMHTPPKMAMNPIERISFERPDFTVDRPLFVERPLSALRPLSVPLRAVSLPQRESKSRPNSAPTRPERIYAPRVTRNVYMKPTMPAKQVSFAVVDSGKAGIHDGQRRGTAFAIGVAMGLFPPLLALRLCLRRRKGAALGAGMGAGLDGRWYRYGRTLGLFVLVAACIVVVVLNIG